MKNKTKYGSLALAGLLASVWAGGSANAGTLDLMPNAQWAQHLSDDEMDLRGGFGGISFSMFYTGFIDSQGNGTGGFVVDTSGAAPAMPSDFSVSDGNVFGSVVGNFGGASGIFQLAVVPGNFNIVENTLVFQIAVVNIINGGAVPSLSSLFGPTP